MTSIDIAFTDISNFEQPQYQPLELSEQFQHCLTPTDKLHENLQAFGGYKN